VPASSAADDGALLLHPETRHIELPRLPERLPGALAVAGGLLRECRVVKDACELPSNCHFDATIWQQDGTLRVTMSQYDTKLHMFDRVEVALEGHVAPWLAS
jgi:hypothetical protein